MAEPATEPTGPAECPETMLVRYGTGRLVGQFRNAPGLRPLCGSKVVVQSERGMEIGEVISVACAECPRAVRRELICRYVQASGPENCRLDAGKVLRLATTADLGEAEHIARNASQMRAYCQQRADELGLAMRVVAVEHVFGGERAIFYFESEGRVDFRSLVRDLAHEYQTRIEMRQIGARDEARLLADYEICGRECCCKSFLKNLKPVNMRMAKTQKATLDPTKVSGRCGRLRCCLRFENETYDYLEQKLPPVNSRVRVEQGVGKVIDRQILTQLLILAIEPEGNRLAVPVEAVLERSVKTAPVVAPPAAPRRGRSERPEAAARANGAAGPAARQSPVGPAAPAGDQADEGPATDASPAGPLADGESSPRPADQPAEGGARPAGRRGRRRRRRRDNRGAPPGTQQGQAAPPSDGRQPDSGGPGESRPSPPAAPQ